MELISKPLNKIFFQGRWSRLIKLLPALIIMILVFIAPLVQLFTVSVWKYDPTGVLLATDFTLENYLVYLNNPFYRSVVFNTLRLGFITSSVCLIIGYLLAYILARANLRNRNLIIFILLTPLFVSVVVRVFGWSVILERSGVINYLLLSIGLIDKPIGLMRTEFAVIVGLVNVLLTFMVMPIYSILISIRPSLEEAAQTLGANPLACWFKITLPLSFPGVVAGWSLVFVMTINSYVQPAVLGGPSFFVMATVVRSQITGSLNWPLAASSGFMLLIVGLIAVYLPVSIIRKTLISKIEGGGY